jgi:hypothetical protein
LAAIAADDLVIVRSSGVFNAGTTMLVVYYWRVVVLKVWYPVGVRAIAREPSKWLRKVKDGLFWREGCVASSND